MNKILKLFKDKDKKTIYNIVAALVIGIILIIMSNTLFKAPVNKNSKNIKSTQSTVDKQFFSEISDFESKLEKKLEECLSMVEGVGKVKVMITLKNNKEIVVASDSSTDQSRTIEEDKGGGKREINSNKSEDKTVILGGSEPLVLKEMQPKIEGVIIIAEGGNNIEVKNSLIKATEAVLSVEPHKIEVLKMK